VADDGTPADEVAQAGQHLCRSRGAGDHLRANAGELGDELWDRAFGVDQLGEVGDEFAAAHDHCADLDQPVPSGGEAGRLDIQHDEFEIIQRLGGEFPCR
jgi:hypothetical protein